MLLGIRSLPVRKPGQRALALQASSFGGVGHFLSVHVGVDVLGGEPGIKSILIPNPCSHGYCS